MNLNLTEKDLNEVLSAAILELLSPDKREELVKEAVKALITSAGPPPNAYSSQPTPSLIQRAVADAARKVAEKLVEEQLASDEQFKARVRQLVIEAYDAVFNDEVARAKIVAGLGEALQTALMKGRGY